ncbi:MAG: hypothetical protein STSR0002_16620 [Smithella sp.]|jgi:hypothetical protein
MMVTIQGQAENMFNSYLNQANWMPPDLKKTMEDFTATYKKSCDEYKKQSIEPQTNLAKEDLSWKVNVRVAV